MEWQTPKTDWRIQYDAAGRYTGDHFEAADYNRIIGNLEYLQNLRNTLWPSLSLGFMGEVTQADFAFASDFNLLEENLQKLVASSADPGIGPLHRWEGNGDSPTAADLNRIEGGMLALYQMLQQQKNAQPKLAFGLNRREF